VNAVTFSRTGQWLASASNDGTVKLWEVEPSAGHRQVLPHGALVNAGVSPGGQQLASISLHERKLRLWNTRPNGSAARFKSDTEAFWSVASCRRKARRHRRHDGSLHLWDTSSGASAITMPRRMLTQSFRGSCHREAKIATAAAMRTCPGVVGDLERP